MYTRSSTVGTGVEHEWPAIFPLTFMASIAIGSMLVFAVSLIVSAFWTLSIGRDLVTSARRAEVNNVGAVLVNAAQHLLATEDLVTLQNLVVETGQRFDLTTCRMMLANGEIVADIDPAAVSVHELPLQWASTTDITAPTAAREADVVLDLPVTVQGRGRAHVHVAAQFDHSTSIFWRGLAGSSVIVLLASGAFLFMLQFIRRPLLAIIAIRQALLAIRRGEQAHSALTIRQELGSEAEGWNQLIDENKQLRSYAVARRTDEAMTIQGRSNGDLESACDAMWQGLIVVDRHLVAKYVNGAAAVKLQTKREQIDGKPITQFIQDKRVIEAIQAGAEGPSAQRRTFEVERASDARNGGGGMLRISVRPVRRTDPTGVVILIEDITQLRAAENAHHAFVSQATHELRTPLTNIRLYVENLLGQDEDDPILKAKSLNVINEESRRLERIVGDMLSVAEIEAGSYQIQHDDVRLDEILTQIQANNHAHAEGKQIDLTLNLPPKLPVIQGDRDKIMLTLQNLVGNALKYTPSGGKIGVNVEVDDAQITIGVQDTGLGISEEEVDLVFEKFYRCRDKRLGQITGSGLGLALAREVARMHGGDITVESELDRGSTFTLMLPTTAEAA